MADYIGDINNNTIIGSSGDDRIIGRGGDDTLTGGAGRDIFVYDIRGFGRDTVTDFNPNGIDRIDLSGLNIGDFETLKPFMTQVGGDVVIAVVFSDIPETIRIKNVVIGSLDAGDFVFNLSSTPLTVYGNYAWSDPWGHGYPGNDILFGGNADDTVYGYSGYDTLVGGAGDDRLEGDYDDDTLTGGVGRDAFVYDDREFGHDRVTDFNPDGVDRIDLSALHVGDFESVKPFMTQVGADVVIAFGYYLADESIRLVNVSIGSLDAGDFIFNTSPTPLTVHGDSGGNNVLFGGSASDKIYGYQGNDTLTGGAGDDFLVGDSGADRFFGGIGTDTVSYFGVFGPVTVDLEAGTGSRGSAEGDRFSGVENVHGGPAGDRLTGDAGANILAGYEGSDVLTGGAGKDVLRGGAGADHLIGGIGIDTASYFGAAAGVTVDLWNNMGRRGEAEGDSLEGVENVHGGTREDDLSGDAGANLLAGYEGNDMLAGGYGNDILRGGTGTDTLAGGFEADRFVFEIPGDSVVGANADRILDFSQVQGDRIDLSGIDADRGTAGNQAFTFIGNGLYTGQAGEMRFAQSGGSTTGSTTVAGDVTGDGVSDFHIVLKGTVSLVAADFAL